MKTITITIDKCLDCKYLDCSKRKLYCGIPDGCPIWLAAEQAKAETAKRIEEVASEATKPKYV